MKTVAIAAATGVLLGLLAVWSMNRQHESRTLPPPAWFRDTIGVVCSGCEPKLQAANSTVVAAWRHPGAGDALAVSFGRSGNLDRYDLHGRSHAVAHAVAVSPSGTPEILVWTCPALQLVARGHDGWDKPHTIAQLARAPEDLQLAYAGTEPVAAWLAGGKLTVRLAGSNLRLSGRGAILSFTLEGGSEPVIVWRDAAGVAVWHADRTVRLGPASAQPQISGRYIAWRDGTVIRLATVNGQVATVAGGVHGPVAVASAGRAALVAYQEDNSVVLRTVSGAHVADSLFPVGRHEQVTGVQVVADRTGAAAVIWEEDRAMVKAVARPAGKAWSKQPSELTRRDETAGGVQAAVDGAGRVFVVWDNHGFIGETVELAQIDLGS